MARRYFFIVNPMAGKGRHLSYVRDIEQFCSKANIPYQIQITTAPGHATQLAKSAASAHDVIVAVGGDGTVNEVIKGMYATPALLGILPTGSGNDFAHQLSYSADVKRSLEILARARTKHIDLCQINGERIMCNGFGVGFDGEVADHFREYTKFVSGFLAYFLSVLRTLPTFQFKSAQLVLDDDRTILSKVLLVAVCNGTTYGGGFKVAPSAKMDDGLLTICMVKKIPKMYALRKLSSFMRGTHIHLPEVETYTAKKVYISVQPASVSQVDGEVSNTKKEFLLQILPQTVSVIYS